MQVHDLSDVCDHRGQVFVPEQGARPAHLELANEVGDAGGAEEFDGYHVCRGQDERPWAGHGDRELRAQALTGFTGCEVFEAGDDSDFNRRPVPAKGA